MRVPKVLQQFLNVPMATSELGGEGRPGRRRGQRADALAGAVVSTAVEAVQMLWSRCLQPDRDAKGNRWLW